MENPRQLAQDLKKNFCADVLFDVARKCRNLALDTLNPAPFFVLEKVLAGVAENWDRPLDVDEASQTKDKLLKPIVDLLDALALDSPNEDLLYLCNRLVSVYLEIVPESDGSNSLP